MSDRSALDRERVARGAALLTALVGPIEAPLELGEVGAAARLLGRAVSAGQRVVPTWVVPAGVFSSVAASELPAGHDLAALLRVAGRPDAVERIARARERVLESELPGALTRDLEQLVRRPPPGAAGFRVAVSATLHEAATAAVAGLGWTEQVELAPNALAPAVRRAWAAALDDETLAALRGARVRDLGLAVLVQALPLARVTGVLLTRDGERTTRVARLTLRAGTTQAVTLRFPPGVGDLARWPAARARSRGAPSAPTRRLARALDHAAAALATADPAPLLVQFMGTARGEVAIVDVRPTAAPAPLRATAHVWTRAGLDGAVPSVPTLSSWSAGSRAVAAALARELDALGGERTPPEQVLGRFSGRVYYDLGTVLPSLARVRGLDLGALLDDVDRELVTALARCHEVSPGARSLPELALASLALAPHEARVRQQAERFERRAGAERRWIAELDLAILPDDALTTTLRNARALVEDATTLVVEATLGVALAHVVVSALVGRVGPGGAPSQPVALTVALATAETAMAGSELAEVVDRGRGDRGALEALAAAARRVEELPHGPLRLGLEGWLATHGDRGVDELELARPRFREEPATLLAIARLLARTRASPPAPAQSRVRVSADRALAELEARASWIDRPLLARAIPALRGMLALREGRRVALARAVALLRVVLLDVDRRLRRLDARLPAGAAFHCSLDELAGALRSTRADLGAVVHMRQATYARWVASPDPPATFVERPPALAVASGARLRGAGTADAVVEGRVTVVDAAIDALERVDADSIVVTPSLDLGLVPLALGARAVVTERGGALAHAAVVLRQWGVPAVLGAAGALGALRAGAVVRVDAARGEVEVV
ncbi:MAG: hypothetical protein IT376_18925 [Polyangiaceae bacterium]|nr:hypothetical protein [Polyangiaceae bacterium]